MPPEYYTVEQGRKLPPLILHPFSDPASPGKMMEGSRASLMLQGVLPNEHASIQQLEQALLDGRICEIRMLYYVGKDLLRWIDQCLDFLARTRDSHPDAFRPQAFAGLLIDHTPSGVRKKLCNWGVQDYRSIFARAIGLNAVFAEAPGRDTLGEDFIRNYHSYSDAMYNCWQQSQPYKDLDAEMFEFELFASAEYSRLLEQQWTRD